MDLSLDEPLDRTGRPVEPQVPLDKVYIQIQATEAERQRARREEEARRLREKVRHLVVAGGLRPENIGAAIREVGPDAVDVSTGVESAPGKKDRAKLTSLFAAVEAARPEVVR